jgi:hypothetical protein
VVKYNIVRCNCISDHFVGLSLVVATIPGSYAIIAIESIRAGKRLWLQLFERVIHEKKPLKKSPGFLGIPLIASAFKVRLPPN